MKYKIILGILIVGILGFLLYSNFTKPNPPQPKDNPPAQIDSSPKILSTKPEPLEGAIISANEVIEFTFSRALENEGELKIKTEPKMEYDIKLSQDRKNAKIIPVKPYELGTTYTLFLGPDTKFEGLGKWGQEKIFHFKTVRYRGV